MNFLNIFEYFTQFFNTILILQKSLVQDAMQVWCFLVRKKVKNANKIVLGNLEQKVFFGTQPWWTTSKESYLKR